MIKNKIITDIDVLFEWDNGDIDKQLTVKGFIRRLPDNSLEINLNEAITIEPGRIGQLVNIRFRPTIWPEDAHVIMRFELPMYEGDVVNIQPSVILSFS